MVYILNLVDRTRRRRRRWGLFCMFCTAAVCRCCVLLLSVTFLALAATIAGAVFPEGGVRRSLQLIVHTNAAGLMRCIAEVRATTAEPISKVSSPKYGRIARGDAHRAQHARSPLAALR